VLSYQAQPEIVRYYTFPLAVIGSIWRTLLYEFLQVQKSNFGLLHEKQLHHYHILAANLIKSTFIQKCIINQPHEKLTENYTLGGSIAKHLIR
jgi:hypothetical protein